MMVVLYRSQDLDLLKQPNFTKCHRGVIGYLVLEKLQISV